MKIGLFKLINGTMALLCAGIMLVNRVDVTVLNNEKAISTIGDNVFEYTNTDSLFSVYKNGEFIGQIPTIQKMHFNSNKPFLQCNAVVIAGKIIAAGIAAQVAGQAFGAAAIAELQATIGAVGGAAVAGGAASIQLPGATAVSATLGGAGEAVAAATAADAALAAGGTMAVISSVIVPVLIGAGIAAGLA